MKFNSLKKYSIFHLFFASCSFMPLDLQPAEQRRGNASLVQIPHFVFVNDLSIRCFRSYSIKTENMKHSSVFLIVC